MPTPISQETHMFTKRKLRLFIGLILYALGIVFTIQANLGLSPWDALHSGLSRVMGITFGQVSILVGFIVVSITYQFHEPIGIGTILNTFSIGLFIDYFFYIDLIKLSNHFLSGVFMLFLGMFLIALASFFYIGSGYGTGPRDGLMVALTRTTKKPVGLIRGSIEMTVLFLGYLLGAKIGIGTLLLAFGMGPIIQLTFKHFSFDVSRVTHDFFLQKQAS